MIVSAGQDQDHGGISVALWVVGETRAWAMKEQIRIRMRSMQLEIQRQIQLELEIQIQLQLEIQI